MYPYLHFLIKGDISCRWCEDDQALFRFVYIFSQVYDKYRIWRVPF